MKEWVPISEGEYETESAFLVAKNHAVRLENTIINVFRGKDKTLKLEGQSLASNYLMAELLDHDDHLDLYLDFGDSIIFCLKSPKIKAGKVFSPDVQSTIQFTPTIPWRKVSQAAYLKLVETLQFLSI